MEIATLATHTCSCADAGTALPSARRMRGLSAMAERLQAVVQVADMLTEKPELTEADLVALDVLLAAMRDCAADLIWQIGQLPAATGDGPTPTYA